jgi:hypothetical protein
MTRPDPRNVCDGCGQSFDRRLRCHAERGPIVHDDIWQQLAANPRERLCFICMDLRAATRGHVLRLADLRPCRWNLYSQPHSYFDVFVQRDGGDPSANLAEWRSVGELATPTEGTVMRRPMKLHITPRSDGGLVAC